jgi:hypothetical protein
MITVNFICPCERITEDVVLEFFRVFSDFNEAKQEDRQVVSSQFLFLKDIQENILDKYLDVNRYIASQIRDNDVLVDGYDICGYGDNAYGVAWLIKKYFSELVLEEHVTRVVEAIRGGFLSESLDPLDDCYRIVQEIKIVPVNLAHGVKND